MTVSHEMFRGALHFEPEPHRMLHLEPTQPRVAMPWHEAPYLWGILAGVLFAALLRPTPPDRIWFYIVFAMTFGATLVEIARRFLNAARS